MRVYMASLMLGRVAARNERQGFENIIRLLVHRLAECFFTSENRDLKFLFKATGLIQMAPLIILAFVVIAIDVPPGLSSEVIPVNTLWPKSIYCAHSSSHIGCRFQTRPHSTLSSGSVTYDIGDTPSIGSGCGSVLSRGLTQDQKTAILDAHNARRSEIASGKIYDRLPGAANMARLVWDPQAAGLAQLYADQCIQEIPRGIETLLPDGDAVRNFQLKYMESPNITDEEENAVLSSSTIDFEKVVSIWLGEVEKFVLDDVYQYVPDLRTTKFTQLAWATTLAVGCGYIKHKVESAEITDQNFLKDLDANISDIIITEEHKTWINEELICHYAPGGNLAGHPIYTPGKPCASCPSYIPVCKDMLCSIN